MRLFLLLTLSLLFNASYAANCLSVALSSFANQADIERTREATEFWKLYKNDPQFSAFLESSKKVEEIEQRYQQLLRRSKGLPPLPQDSSSVSPLSILDRTDTMPDKSPSTNAMGTIADDATASMLEMNTRSDATNSLINSTLVNYDLKQVEKDLLALVNEYQSLPNYTRASIPSLPPKKHSLDLSFNRTSYSPNEGIVLTDMPGLGATQRRLMHYEETVSNIRAGDVIDFNATGAIAKKEFKIGQYIGAGNATHIYEIAEGGTGSGSLIRIPASADFISQRPRKIIENRVISTDGSYIDHRSPNFDQYYPEGRRTKKKEQDIYDKDYTSFRLSWQYVNKRASSICDESMSTFFSAPCYYTVKILSHDPNYRWVEVEKINIEQSYESFKQNYDQVIQLVDQKKTDMQIKRMYPSLDQTLLTEIRKKSERLRKVKDLAMNSGASDFRPAQLAWAKRPDTGEMDWILLDW